MNRILTPRENRIHMHMVPPHTPFPRADTADLKQKRHDCSRCWANCSTNGSIVSVRPQNPCVLCICGECAFVPKKPSVLSICDERAFEPKPIEF